jgi:Arm DNA-binding domain
MPLRHVQIRKDEGADDPSKQVDFDGIYIKVSPAGSRLWHMKYRIEGVEKRLSFGIYPSVSLAMARKPYHLTAPTIMAAHSRTSDDVCGNWI